MIRNPVAVMVVLCGLLSAPMDFFLADLSPPAYALAVECVPPFGGTIFIDSDIIISSDPTAFLGAVYTGQGLRYVYDRRFGWIWMDAYLFDATYDDGLTAEIQVNPEFGSSAAAEIEALKYGWAVGQLPTALRADVWYLWIHQGVYPFGGGNNSILIHTGQAASYESSGILEETLVHEATHTSLDAAHAGAPGWLNAQAADDCFISTYARDHPLPPWSEDVSESFLTYLAIRYRSDRISEALEETILLAIPNRIAYFDEQLFDMYPVADASTPFRRADCNDDGIVDVSDAGFNLAYLFQSGPTTCLDSQDTNGDGAINVADPIFNLTYQFSMGPPPPDPFPDCGINPTQDSLGCSSYRSCP